ncbi:hypothetical protein APHAL10511_004667 [Amanita phalloides]|nr:hypothetical protein APHAL10511_004667 [Amanita phalloides]
MSTKSSWEDLAKLGKTKREIFLTLNPKRGNTMSNEGHLHLNDWMADQYGWYCYNVVKGQAVKAGSVPINIQQTDVRHVWDNTHNSQPQKEKWTETMTRTYTASLTTTVSASIKLESSITVPGVGGGSVSLTVGTESKKEDKYEEKHEIKREFEIEVGPYEKLELRRTQTDLGAIATYRVPYGANGLIGTQGEKYNGHYYWAYSFNGTFGDPTSYIELNGSSKETDYTFTLVRTGGKGVTQSNVKYLNPAADDVQLDILDDDAFEATKALLLVEDIRHGC